VNLFLFMKMSKRKNKESEYIDRLEDLIRVHYTEFRRNVKWSRNGEDGEIDLMGRVGNYWDIYEVKSTDHPRALKRAESQLNRLLRVRPYPIRRTYIYIGKTENLKAYR